MTLTGFRGALVLRTAGRRGGREGTGGAGTRGRAMLAPNDTERRPEERGKLIGESTVRSRDDSASDLTDLVEGPIVLLLTLTSGIVVGHPNSSNPRPVSYISV